MSGRRAAQRLLVHAGSSVGAGAWTARPCGALGLRDPSRALHTTPPPKEPSAAKAVVSRRAPVEGPLKVLFCGHDMTKGYEFTKEELEAADPSAVVTRCQRGDVLDHARDAHVLVPLMTRIEEHVIASSPDLRMIIQYGVGIEGIPHAAATAAGIDISNIPSEGTGNAASSAEHAIYLALSVLRDQSGMAGSVAQRQLGTPLGTMMAGLTALVIGFGNIAKELIPRLNALGVVTDCVRAGPWPADAAGAYGAFQDGGWPEKALGESHRVQHRGCESNAREGNLASGYRSPWSERDVMSMVRRRGCGRAGLLDLAGSADVVFVACPQTPYNKGLIGREFLTCCRPGVRIVNVSRGGLMDYDACKAELQSGRIGGMGLDVQWHEPFDPSDPLATHPNVVLTPHVAGVTDVSYRAMARILAGEALRVKQGLRPSRLVEATGKPISDGMSLTV
ncbi:unnamed protein product [Pedinophyceae sp. YPF-701]|nr:unnamed protein product [Pedinophyceae sp. YPF-701]